MSRHSIDYCTRYYCYLMALYVERFDEAALIVCYKPRLVELRSAHLSIGLCASFYNHVHTRLNASARPIPSRLYHSLPCLLRPFLVCLEISAQTRLHHTPRTYRKTCGEPLRVFSSLRHTSWSAYTGSAQTRTCTCRRGRSVSMVLYEG